MKREDLELLLSRLTAVRDHDRQANGICYLAVGKYVTYNRGTDSVPAYHYAWLKEAYTRWPEYSGNDIYPVPAPDVPGVSTPQEAFGYLHPWHGEYGDTRKRLLVWLIERAEKELAHPDWRGVDTEKGAYRD